MNVVVFSEPPQDEGGREDPAPLQPVAGVGTESTTALSPGENFTITGFRVCSPFVHTLICGDSNGLLGYIGTDEETDRGGAETRASWRLTAMEGFRLPLAKGSARVSRQRPWTPGRASAECVTSARWVCSATADVAGKNRPP